MTLRQLKYALAVRDHGTMSSAAEACHVSQPSLSEGVKKLEETLGVVLFERGSRGARPTAEGEAILEQAERVVSEMQIVEEMATAASHRLLEGRLRVGVIQTLGPYLLPRVLPDLEDRYPDLELEVTEGLTDELLDSLASHDLDAVFLALPWDIPEGIAVTDSFDEQFFVAAPPEDPVTRQRRVALDDVDPNDLLLLKEGHCLRSHTLEACDIPPRGTRRAFQGASLETIREFIASGWGVGLFPAMALDSNRDVAVLPTVEPSYRQIGIAVRRSYPHLEEIGELADYIAELVGEAARGEHLEIDERPE